MSAKTKQYKNYFVNLIFPAFVFGSITGVITSAIVLVYKYLAHHVIHYAEVGYGFVKTHLWLIPVVLIAFFGIAMLWKIIYHKLPNLRGGGIPTSIAALRDIIDFKWLSNLIGVFFMSLVSFLIGVPLGNEGPSVQMGTAVGSGTVRCFAKKHLAWEKYSMTGGACAGFSVATGAPISGVLFAIEEAHQRVSPMIIMVAATSVMFANITTELLAPILGVSKGLFPALEFPALDVKDIWIPLLVAVVAGIFAGLFLNYYRLIDFVSNKKLAKMPKQYKILAVFAITLALGLCSFSFISTGHELVLELFEGRVAIGMLLLILLLRATTTLLANTNGITGGIFLPLLALGAVISALIAEVGITYFGLGESYYGMILALGIVACISGMMKMPLTAIVFAVEALSFHEHILFVIVTSAVTYVITELFSVKSINDSVIENRTESVHEGKVAQTVDTTVCVGKNAFAVGKEVRDIFWPRNVFVLSVQHSADAEEEVDDHGGSGIREGDILHIRYSTYDEAQTKEELFAIVGEQG